MPGRCQTSALLSLFFLSGLAALVYEISWTRQIGLVFGHTVYAASTVLAAFFGGMAVGYLAAAPLAERTRRPLLGYAWCEFAAAAWACAIPFCIALLSRGHFASLLHHQAPLVQHGIRASVCFLLMLPATVALGATLPLMAAQLTRTGDRAAWYVPLAYALNTAGAVVGVSYFPQVLVLILRGFPRRVNCRSPWA